MGQKMTAVVLDGKHVAKLTEEALSVRVEGLKERSGGRIPVLATVLVGDDPASATYVKMKGNACRRIGMESMAIELPSTLKTNELLRELEVLNNNPDVHGILLQHPVPSQIDERAAFDMIDLSKDVDGVTCLGGGIEDVQSSLDFMALLFSFARGRSSPSSTFCLASRFIIRPLSASLSFSRIFCLESAYFLSDRS